MGNLGQKFKAWRDHPVPAKYRPDKTAPLSLARPGWMGFPNSYNPHGKLTLRHQVKWIATPRPKPKAVTHIKRNVGVPALIKIAAQPAKKLVRKYATAEALLSERKHKVDAAKASLLTYY